MSELATQPLEERQSFIKRFAETNDPGMRRELLTPLIAPNNKGFFTSLGPLFESTIFGRDSTKMAEDIQGVVSTNLTEIDHFELETLSQNVIVTLAGLQGITDDLFFSEERPGKIHHEYRHRLINDEPVNDEVQKIITRLREEKEWAPPDGSKDELCYYGSVDSTPLYIRLVKGHVKTFGGAILHESVKGRDGMRRTIADTIVRAAQHIYDEIGRSKSGLLEFKRTNPHGLASQSWKDSPAAFLHLDGTPANYDGGVAAVDVQGYAFDALMDAAALLPTHWQAAEWRARAGDLKDRTLRKLWLPDQNYFAQGLDYDDDGRPRQIATITSDAAVLLSTGILDGEHLSRERAKVFQRVLGGDFMTEAGPRLRSITHLALEDSGVSYHGCQVMWPKEQNEIIKGAERMRDTRAAQWLGEQSIRNCIRSGEFYEFLHVDPYGRPTYLYGSNGVKEHNFDAGEAKDPQGWQGWTLTAFIRAVDKRHNFVQNAA